MIMQKATEGIEVRYFANEKYFCFNSLLTNHPKLQRIALGIPLAPNCGSDGHRGAFLAIFSLRAHTG